MIQLKQFETDMVKNNNSSVILSEYMRFLIVKFYDQITIKFFTLIAVLI
jgi:hypothetical protein